jgi:hypothetical protein
MEQSIRMLAILRYALLGSILLYIAVGETLGRMVAPNMMVFYALTFAAITTVGAMLVIRKTMVAPAEAVLRLQPDDAASTIRWRTGCIVTYALSEAVAIVWPAVANHRIRLVASGSILHCGNSAAVILLAAFADFGTRLSKDLTKDSHVH